MVKGMNHYKNLHDRRKTTLQLLEDELIKLQQGYNQIRGNVATDVGMNDITSNTMFLKALATVEVTISAAASTKRDLKA